MTKEDESVEEAKARLAAEQKEREAKSVADREKRERKHKAVVEANSRKAEKARIQKVSRVEAGRKAGME